MKKILLTTLILGSIVSLKAQNQIERPKIVVGIVVDQMRQEYLHRFYNHFGEGGFKRLISDGYAFQNAHYNYIPTATGPGHASIYSGTTPRMHGIIENAWFDKHNRKFVNCVEDQSVSNVGGSESAGIRSPKNLLTTTITDELGLFFQGSSKVVSVSIKDRGAILPGGHNPTGAYWYDGKTGEFMTSSYYMSKLPKWVKTFNKRKLPEQYMKWKWETLKPIASYVESAEDNRSYERALTNDIEPVFPYDLKKITEGRNAVGMLASTPFGNTAVLEIALAAMEGEQLGVDEITDFLAISFSSTDYIGHAYGPYSKEIQDAYVRLDRELERLFATLDEKVGKGQWVTFLTADHAVADTPHGLKEKKYPVDYWDGKKRHAEIKLAIERKFNAPGLVDQIAHGHIFLDHKVIDSKGLGLSVVKSHIINYLIGINGISGAYDVTQLHTYVGNQYDVGVIAAGLNPSRSGDIVFTLMPGWLGEYYMEKGSGHGTHYSYDTHVPLLFYGWGISQGESVKYQPITDIAPTLSMLLKIKLPSGCVGQPIGEVLGFK